jgi:biotin carboxyl carrier protein
MPVYRVTVGDTEYTVEVPNPAERPVRAIVDGETVEVHVEEEGGVPAPRVEVEAPAPTIPVPAPPGRPVASSTGAPGTGVVTAPLPGVITAVSVDLGEDVDPGEELCVLEAMKMKNPIRSTVSGTVREVHVALGEQVQHGDPLFTIED